MGERRMVRMTYRLSMAAAKDHADRQDLEGEAWREARTERFEALYPLAALCRRVLLGEADMAELRSYLAEVERVL